MAKAPRDWGKMRLNKTVSMDFDLVQKIMDEADEMGRDFSSSVCILIRIGLDGRRISKERSAVLSPEERKLI